MSGCMSYALFSLLGQMEKRIDNVSSRVEEINIKIGQTISFDQKEVKSELTNTIENKSKEIGKELRNEINTLSKRIDDNLLEVDNAITKTYNSSSFDKDALRTELMKTIEHNEKEFMKEFKNEINNITKRIETVSSNLEETIPKVDKLDSFDPEGARLEMLRLIENKGQDISKKLKDEISVVTNSIQINEGGTRELRHRIDSAHELLKEMKNEHILHSKLFIDYKYFQSFIVLN